MKDEIPDGYGSGYPTELPKDVLSCKSESTSSEDFFMRQDEFLIYIEDEANPARAKAGLPEIGQSEAQACFRILEDFYDQWRNPPNVNHEA